MYRYVKSSEDVISALESKFYSSLKTEEGKNKTSLYTDLPVIRNIRRRLEYLVSDVVKQYLPSTYKLNSVYCSTGDCSQEYDPANNHVDVTIVSNQGRKFNYIFMFSPSHDYMKLYTGKIFNEDVYVDEKLNNLVDAVERINISDIMLTFKQSCRAGAKLYEYTRYDEPIRKAYLSLFGALLKVKKDYLLQSEKDSNTFFQMSSRTGNGVYVKAGYNFKKLRLSSDYLEFKEVDRLHLDTDDFHWSDTEYMLQNMGLPLDGTCPTIVSIQDAVPQQKLF